MSGHTPWSQIKHKRRSRRRIRRIKRALSTAAEYDRGPHAAPWRNREEAEERQQALRDAGTPGLRYIDFNELQLDRLGFTTHPAGRYVHVPDLRQVRPEDLDKAIGWLEPCPECGCPGHLFDGHVCEDYLEAIPGVPEVPGDITERIRAFAEAHPELDPRNAPPITTCRSRAFGPLCIATWDPPLKGRGKRTWHWMWWGWWR